MPKNMIELIQGIFSNLQAFIDADLVDRIRNNTPGIESRYKNEEEKSNIDVLQKANIRVVELANNVKWFVIDYEGDFYLAIGSIYSSLQTIVQSDIISGENSDYIGIEEGLNLALIASNNVSVHRTEDISTRLINYIFGLDNRTDITIDTLKTFFDEYIILKILDTKYDLSLYEDIQRLFALVISSSKIDNDNTTLPRDFFEKFNILVEMEVSRSIISTLIKTMLTDDNEQIYLEMYRCIEYTYYVEKIDSGIKRIKDSTTYDISYSIFAEILFSDLSYAPKQRESVENIIRKYMPRAIIVSIAGLFTLDGEKLENKISNKLFECRNSVAHLNLNKNCIDLSTDNLKALLELILDFLLVLYGDVNIAYAVSQLYTPRTL